MEFQELKNLWAEFGNIPINDNDQIEEDFKDFPAGTDKEDVWRWFDELCPRGIAKDLMNL